MTAYQLHNETVHVQQLLHDLAGQLDESDGDLIAGMIEGETRYFEVIDRLLEARAEIEMMIDGLAERAAALAARKQIFERRETAIRAALQRSMEATGQHKIQRSVATLFLGNKPVGAIVTDEAVIPQEYKTPQPPKLDKRALLAALKVGVEIPGATLSNGGTTLTIRSK